MVLLLSALYNNSISQNTNQPALTSLFHQVARQQCIVADGIHQTWKAAHDVHASPPLPHSRPWAKFGHPAGCRLAPQVQMATESRTTQRSFPLIPESEIVWTLPLRGIGLEAKFHAGMGMGSKNQYGYIGYIGYI